MRLPWPGEQNGHKKAPLDRSLAGQGMADDGLNDLASSPSSEIAGNALGAIPEKGPGVGPGVR